jgi:hypothetical protein
MVDVSDSLLLLLFGIYLICLSMSDGGEPPLPCCCDDALILVGGATHLLLSLLN